MDNQIIQYLAVQILPVLITTLKQRMITALVKIIDQDRKTLQDFSKLPKSTMVQPLGR